MSRGDGSLGRALAQWASAWGRAPRAVVIVAAFASATLLYYAVARLHMNTDTTDIISDELPSRQDFLAFRHAFPQLTGSLIVVIDGATAELAEDARARLAGALGTDARHFPWVYAPGGDAFFARNGLLYLDLPALESLSDRLAQAQPLLGPLARNPTLAGLAAALATMARAPPDADRSAVTPLLLALRDTFADARATRAHWVAWSALLGAGDTQGAQRLLLVQPRLRTDSLAPGRAAIEAVHASAGALHIDAAHGLRVRLTGPVALEHEELVSVAHGAWLAAALAFILVAAVLGFGLGSTRLVLTSLATLLVGLTGTAAFAAAAVGELNLISIAFIVLYIGLGIDYCVHYALRYRELREQGVVQGVAIAQAAGDVGASLVLCALTSSVGFFAFYPTTFKGVSQLGLISGTGMWIALVCSLSLLPALLCLWPYDAAPRPARRFVLQPASQWPPPRVAAVALVLALVAALLVPLARFDSNPLNLRAQHSESVTTYRELLAAPDHSPLSLAWLGRDLASARAAAAAADALPAVAHTTTLEDLVPAQQADKLAVIDDLRVLLGPTLAAPFQPAAGGNPDVGLAALLESLRALAGSGLAPARTAADSLTSLMSDLAGLPEAQRTARLSTIENSVVFGLRFQLARLRAALGAQPVSLADLPAELVALWRSADGRYRVDIAPAEDLNVPGASERFVDAVRAVLPHATGVSVIQREAGRAVVRAFEQALITALVAIAVLTLLLMRSLRDTLLVMTPVLLGTLLTVAATVVLDMPFNFANVIALPLLLGVCVDNGIHIVHRHRSGTSPAGVLASSTARAVVVSALTTVVTFGGLAFSSHPGMASMGKLLSLGLAIGLACSLLTLPALLHWTDAGRAGAAP